MSYIDILEKYKDNKIVCKNKEDGRVILQCMKELDPMLFNAEVLDDIKHVDNFLQPYTELGKQLGMSPAMVTKRIKDSCRSFRNPRHRKHISLEVSDSVMEKLINAGYRKTQQIVYDVLYGMHVEGLTEIEHNELCESISKLTGLDRTRFAAYISDAMYVEMGKSTNKALRKLRNLPIAEVPCPRRLTNYIPLDICRKIRDGYNTFDSASYGVMNGMYAEGLTREEYYELAYRMVEMLNLDKRRVAPYFSEETCKSIFGEDWNGMVGWMKRGLVENVAGEFLNKGAYIAVLDFLEENEGNDIVDNNPYDVRVWLQAAKDNSPVLYGKLLEEIPELKNVESFLVSYKELADRTGFNERRIEECKDKLLEIIVSY